MFSKIFVALLLSFCYKFALALDPKCGECMENYAQCIDTTSYYFCDGKNKPLVNLGVQTCPKNTICTDSQKICEPTDNTNAVDVCGQSSVDCDTCSTDGPPFNRIACRAINKFTTCSATGINETDIHSCGDDEICSLAQYKLDGTFCIPRCVAEFLDIKPSCPNLQPAPPKPITTTTPTPVDEEANIVLCEKAESEIPGLSGLSYFFIRVINDPDECKAYLYCQPGDKTKDEYYAVPLKCDTGYVDVSDASNAKCVAKKPDACTVKITTTKITTTKITATPSED